ncbi:MAG: hypothetical protein EOP17_07765 [Rhizobiaceae bacterium]|jgi:hypothetical protein|nr:MAG: hypothetical protein EOP17_07765 [Rhizobiaceae bacterium]
MMIEKQSANEKIPLPGNTAFAGPRFLIGRNRRGGWIVNDRLGLVGGIFVNEAAARHFAIEESDRHYELIAVLDDAAIELEFRKADFSNATASHQSSEICNRSVASARSASTISFSRSLL